MTNKILSVALCLAVLFSCTKEISDTQNNQKSKVIVLQERDPNSPLILSKKRSTKNMLTRGLGETISFDNCIGRSFKCNTYPLGSIEDVGFPVIDLTRFYRDHPSYFSKRRLGEGKSRAFSYSSFTTYSENSKIIKKISGGLSINLGFFSFTAKSKMTDIFTSSRTNDGSTVYGELAIEIRDSSFTMQTSSNITNKIKFNYLLSDFKDELYNTTPCELFNNYGGFVLSSFVTGGRASAFYAGNYSGHQSAQNKEKDMNTDISASYSFKMKDEEKGKVSADLAFGKVNSNGVSSSGKITNLEVSIKTVGGDPLRSNFSVPQNINTLNVDISGWVNSLNDKNSMTIIDISENGLLPLSDLIMEVNLKDAFSKFHNKELTTITKLQEPYLEILCVYNSMSTTMNTYLNTRYGDKILIDKSNYSWDYIDYDKIIQRVNQAGVETKEKLPFGLKITLKPYFSNHEINSSYDYSYPDIDNHSGKIYKTLMQENNIQKFTYNDIIYLLFSFEGEKYAYSIHDDFLLDTYAIRNYVKNLPSVSINPNLLYSSYTIFAL